MAFDLGGAATAIANIVRVLAPVAQGIVSAELGSTIGVAAKIVEGAALGIPAAIGLLDSIKGGNTPTTAQLESYLRDYDAAHDSLNKAIDEEEAALRKVSAPQASSNKASAPPGRTLNEVAASVGSTGKVSK